jgi:predicted nucleotidyltransferase
MLDFLKNSQGELLNLFFRDPEREFYLSEIGKTLNKPASYYQRYLDEYVTTGILLDERKGNLRFFHLNKKFPIYQELKSIISKTIGVEYQLNNLIKLLSELKCAFIFGSIAKHKENASSDIDLILIGPVNQDILINEIVRLELELGRDINYHIYEGNEVVEKIKKGNSFLVNIFTEPMIVLKGDPNEYSRFIKK